MNKTDPTGLAELLWTANDRVTLIFPVTDNGTFSVSALSQQVAADYGGTVNMGGTTVTMSTAVTAIPVGDPAITSRNAATVTADPNIALTSPGRAHVADGIGGKDIRIAPTDGPAVVSHELGHNAGAGDQYVGGVDANGNTVTAAPPNTSNSVMRDLGGPANGPTRTEILNSPDNVNTCNSGVSAANGKC